MRACHGVRTSAHHLRIGRNSQNPSSFIARLVRVAAWVEAVGDVTRPVAKLQGGARFTHNPSARKRTMYAPIRVDLTPDAKIQASEVMAAQGLTLRTSTTATLVAFTTHRVDTPSSKRASVVHRVDHRRQAA